MRETTSRLRRSLDIATRTATTRGPLHGRGCKWTDIETLSENDLNTIAEQIAEALPPELEPFEGSIDLGETFPVWSIVRPTQSDLQAAAVSTGTFHHQLLVNDRPVVYARSRRYPEGWDVSVFQSPLAEKIGEAVAQTDSVVTDDDVTRLLVAERYRVYALWFCWPRR